MQGIDCVMHLPSCIVCISNPHLDQHAGVLFIVAPLLGHQCPFGQHCVSQQAAQGCRPLQDTVFSRRRCVVVLPGITATLVA